MIANNKPVIEDIPSSKHEELNTILLDPKASQNMKDIALKRLTGICLRCGRPAEKLIKYQLEDITRILKYCNNCFELSVIEDKGKDKKVKLLDTGQRNETIAVIEKNDTKSIKSRGEVRHK